MFHNLLLWINEHINLFQDKPRTVYRGLLYSKYRQYENKNKPVDKRGTWKGWVLLEVIPRVENEHT